MSRRFTLLSLALTGVVAFMVGAIVAGGFRRPDVAAGAPSRPSVRETPRLSAPRPAVSTPLVDFADVVERINPAVVNIEATTRASEVGRRRSGPPMPDPPEMFELPRDFPGRSDPAQPRRGTGSGFIIDADGSIITNHHVIDRADRITVKLSDGRTLRARVIGADADSDIALLKVDGQVGLPVATLGDSSRLRMGEWVCAIGNPLGYEHSVTVGVISYLGRKIFDASLDDYIQTDAAISFGNSGGPLINGRGEVIGITTAISSRASNIGFAVPMNTASTILPQLRARGRVARGYIGVGLRSIDADLQQALALSISEGAIVQDVTEGSPADRAGLRPYDLVVSFDGVSVANDSELIRAIASHAPGATARVGVLRDGREESVSVKLAERPARAKSTRAGDPPAAEPERRASDPDLALGLTVRDLDTAAFNRLQLPSKTRGVLITRVEPLSSSFDAEIQRGTVLLEVNRQPIRSSADYRWIARGARPGDVLSLYLYVPDLDQRRLLTVRVDR